MQWDESKKSKKLSLSENCLSCTCNDGSGFKTVLGSNNNFLVFKHCKFTKLTLDYAFTPGNRYYYEVYMNKGTLLKIGVS
jgi:hypothetical protein